MEILTPNPVDLSELAEHLIRTWTLSLEERRKHEAGSTPCSTRLVHDYVTLSGETGVNTSRIADDLATKFGWQVLTQDMVDFLCVQYDWRINLLDYANEAAADWFQNNFGRWLSKRVRNPCEYISRFANIVLLGAQHASYVFQSPLAQFILPPDCGLSVRLVAPLALRAKAIAEQRKCSLKEANRHIRERDAADAGTVRRCFHHNINDLEVHDVVINLEHTTSDSAVDLIIGDYLMRFAPKQVCCAFRIGDDRTSQRL